MGKKYIRVRKDGFIYEFNEQMAKMPTCEVIDESEAFPESEIAKPKAPSRVVPKAAPKAVPAVKVDAPPAKAVPVVEASGEPEEQAVSSKSLGFGDAASVPDLTGIISNEA